VIGALGDSRRVRAEGRAPYQSERLSPCVLAPLGGAERSCADVSGVN